MLNASARAANPRAGLSLDELAAFVQACMRLNLEGTTPVRALTGWHDQILRLAVAVAGPGATELDEVPTEWRYLLGQRP